MKILKNKFVVIFLILLLAISAILGACIYHYGSIYEKQAAVYMKSLDWVLLLSTKYTA